MYYFLYVFKMHLLVGHTLLTVSCEFQDVLSKTMICLREFGFPKYRHHSPAVGATDRTGVRTGQKTRATDGIHFVDSTVFLAILCGTPQRVRGLSIF